MPSKKKTVRRKILEHELVPEHRVLDLEEAAELLKRFNLKPWQLPQISFNDPIVQILGAKPGSIIEITRKSPTGGTAKYYRIVVPV